MAFNIKDIEEQFGRGLLDQKENLALQEQKIQLDARIKRAQLRQQSSQKVRQLAGKTISDVRAAAQQAKEAESQGQPSGVDFKGFGQQATRPSTQGPVDTNQAVIAPQGFQMPGFGGGGSGRPSVLSGLLPGSRTPGTGPIPGMLGFDGKNPAEGGTLQGTPEQLAKMDLSSKQLEGVTRNVGQVPIAPGLPGVQLFLNVIGKGYQPQVTYQVPSISDQEFADARLEQAQANVTASLAQADRDTTAAARQQQLIDAFPAEQKREVELHNKRIAEAQSTIDARNAAKANSELNQAVNFAELIGTTRTRAAEIHKTQGYRAMESFVRTSLEGRPVEAASIIGTFDGNNAHLDYLADLETARAIKEAELDNAVAVAGVNGVKYDQAKRDADRDKNNDELWVPRGRAQNPISNDQFKDYTRALNTKSIDSAALPLVMAQMTDHTVKNQDAYTVWDTENDRAYPVTTKRVKQALIDIIDDRNPGYAEATRILKNVNFTREMLIRPEGDKGRDNTSTGLQMAENAQTLRMVMGQALSDPDVRSALRTWRKDQASTLMAATQFDAVAVAPEKAEAQTKAQARPKSGRQLFQEKLLSRREQNQAERAAQREARRQFGRVRRTGAVPLPAEPGSSLEKIRKRLSE